MQKNEGVCCIQSNETSWTSRPHHLPHRFVGISLLSDKMTDNLQNPSSHNIIRLSRWFRWNYSFVSSASTFLWKFFHFSRYGNPQRVALFFLSFSSSSFPFHLFDTKLAWIAGQGLSSNCQCSVCLVCGWKWGKKYFVSPYR